MVGHYLFLLVLVFQRSRLIWCSSTPVNIAIVGGGIGGTSTAYFLSKLYGSKAVIDILEKNDVGGRLATISFNNLEFENGGSIIHPRNQYMIKFINLLGLERLECQCKQTLGIYNGNFVFEESTNQLVNYAKLFWHYGIGLITLQYHINSLLSSFDKIYALQDEGRTFETVKDLLFAMNKKFPEYLNIASEEAFSHAGFSNQIINDFILPIIRCNYGQSTKIHQFVGAVSTAGADSGVWAIKGGNKKVSEGLVNVSNSNLLKEKVYDIELLKSKRYNVTSNKRSKIYDVVVIATPITEDHEKINFKGFGRRIKDNGVFHITVCTMVIGVLNSTYFRQTEIPNVILTSSNKLFFYSLSQVYPVNGDCNTTFEMWKIFSEKPLSKLQLYELFWQYEVVSETNWLAYPHYSTNKRNDSFILHNNMYYVNAIEWAASAMEMSIISAKNIAMLIYNKLNNISHHTQALHNEL